jgi:GTP-binding protein HflX
MGFIDRLPLSLIEAFHSTLEETIFSDLIILVLDINEPIETVRKKNRTCQETIDRIGASDVPVITALNKIDRLSEEEAQQKFEELKGETKNPILISAKKGTNLEIMKQEILKKLEGFIEASFSLPSTSAAMSLISWVHKGADVKKTEYIENSVKITFDASPEFIEKAKSRVKGLGGTFEVNLNPK